MANIIKIIVSNDINCFCFDNPSKRVLKVLRLLQFKEKINDTVYKKKQHQKIFIKRHLNQKSFYLT
jgi:hypothetical protein